MSPPKSELSWQSVPHTVLSPPFCRTTVVISVSFVWLSGIYLWQGTDVQLSLVNGISLLILFATCYEAFLCKIISAKLCTYHGRTPVLE